MVLLRMVHGRLTLLFPSNYFIIFICIQFSLVNVGLSNVYFTAFLLFHWER
jgi:hypothetical protein